MNNTKNKNLFEDISDEVMLKASDLLEEKHRLEQELKILEEQLNSDSTCKKKTKSIKECPVCYCDLDIDNIVNLQCSHSLCKGCFKNWIDEGGKNSCPQCRADVLSSAAQKIRFQKRISDYECEIHDLEDEVNENNYTINNQLDMITNLRKQKKVLKQHLIMKHQELEELEKDCEYWENKYDVQEAKSDEIYNKWLKNPDLAIKHWEKKKSKIYNGEIKKTKNYKKKCIAELNNVFELMDNWPKKPSFIRNHAIAYDIADKYKKKYDAEKEVDLSEFNIFQEDTSSYTDVGGLESRLIPNKDNESEKEDEHDDETQYDSIPELLSPSETDSDEENYGFTSFGRNDTISSILRVLSSNGRILRREEVRRTINITPRSLEREFNSNIINNSD